MVKGKKVNARADYQQLQGLSVDSFIELRSYRKTVLHVRPVVVRDYAAISDCIVSVIKTCGLPIMDTTVFVPAWSSGVTSTKCKHLRSL